LISRSSLSVRWSSDPSLGPLVALCIGVVTRRRQSATRALGTLVLGFAVGMAATVILTWILTALGLLNESMLIAERPLTSFIWKPDALSWIVGFLAGIAGMLALTSAKSGALVGVLISVTTIPAAANVAVAIAYWVPSEAIGSVIQLVINLSAIASPARSPCWCSGHGPSNSPGGPQRAQPNELGGCPVGDLRVP
jgi:uncharacterized hydrophobic protein (TIGR00271 family)